VAVSQLGALAPVDSLDLVEPDLPILLFTAAGNLSAICSSAAAAFEKRAAAKLTHASRTPMKLSFVYFNGASAPGVVMNGLLSIEIEIEN
jgi:hypothetical protein